MVLRTRSRSPRTTPSVPAPRRRSRRPLARRRFQHREAATFVSDLIERLRHGLLTVADAPSGADTHVQIRTAETRAGELPVLDGLLPVDGRQVRQGQKAVARV